MESSFNVSEAEYNDYNKENDNNNNNNDNIKWECDGITTSEEFS